MSNIDEMEDVCLTLMAFNALPEYSLTLPTGTTVGKRWKCRMDLFTKYPYKEMVGSPVVGEWVMGEYVEHSDPDKVGIKWRKIVVEE